MMLLSIVTLPLLGALIIPLLARRSTAVLPALVAGAIGITVVAMMLSQAVDVLGGAVLIEHYPWLPSLGLSPAFRLDALALFFALIIAGMGILITFYAHFYFAGKHGTVRFHSLMLAFMGAMLGIVMSENLLFMLVFWEMTSLISFVLIGFHQDERPARRGARMTLVITGGGGLALLAGVLLIGNSVGSFRLTDILAPEAALTADPLYPWMLGLVLLGAMTKSAQFPFHLWLPNAMTAPTPVSAYLHSATMVKAGIFLLARLHLVLGDTEAWLYGVSTAGMATLLSGAFIAMFKHDTKELLAYSTVSHLGLITLLVGLNTRMAMVAALFHLLNHALVKAPLFMMAGAVQKATGTRDMRQINGLWRTLPALMVISAVAAASMAGLPLLGGYLSKKMFFIESLQAPVVPPLQWITPALAAIAGLFSVAYALRIFHNVFFNGQPRNLPVWPPKNPGVGIQVPAGILALAVIGVSWHAEAVVHAVIGPVASVASGQPLPDYDMHQLHHIGTAFFMSLAAMLGGLLLYMARQPLFRLYDQLPPADAREIFEWMMTRTGRSAERLVHGLENGSVQRYIALIVLTAIVLVGPVLFSGIQWHGGEALTPIDPLTSLGLILLMATAVGTALGHHQRLFALLLLGSAGLFVTLTFARFSAPDLALTQLSVEVMAVIIMMLALSFLPQDTPRESSRFRKGRDLGIAGLGGLGVGMVAFAIITRPHSTIAEFFLDQSKPGGGGSNVVNVILVDFRGFDTLGEITVLGIAAVAVFALTRNLQLKDRIPQERDQYWASNPHPLILRTMARPILPIALMVSAYIFLRGHNMPGGGFIAGLITAVALSLQYMAGSMAWAHNRMLTSFRPLIGVGLLLACGTGVGSLLFGEAFLSSWHGHFSLPVLGHLELATALLFDLGVFATVVGATLLILANLGKLMTVHGPGKEVG
ncbi:monovalent cation/H+ antiporter subunit A [Halomonadaceae bacterium KBTZ08]